MKLVNWEEGGYIVFICLGRVGPPLQEIDMKLVNWEEG